jgi:cyclase
VDITATAEDREPDYESVAEFSAECFVPLTVGGGISSLEHITKLLRAGADKVSINSAAYDNPQIVQEASARFGAQCIVASLDVRKMSDGSHQCWSHSGTVIRNIDPLEWAKKMEESGAGEILITSVERDGTMNGYDIELIKKVSSSVNIPVIASGGAGNYENMKDALKYGGCSAVAAASIFHFTEMTPIQAKLYLSNSGIKVRL